MGRYPDDPRQQLAKGAPGRRRRQVERAAARLEEKIAASQGKDPLRIPDQFVEDPDGWRIAIRLWVQQSGVLRTSGRAQAGFVPALARYCIWSQIFELASTEFSTSVKTTGTTTVVWTKGDGNDKLVPHPAIDIMADAERIIAGLETEFGFTPRSDADLTRVGIFNSRQGVLPFGPTPQKPGADAAASSGAAVDPMSLMGSSDSPPPGSLN